MTPGTSTQNSAETVLKGLQGQQGADMSKAGQRGCTGNRGDPNIQQKAGPSGGDSGWAPANCRHVRMQAH